jgi:hypothetical protein
MAIYSLAGRTSTFTATTTACVQWLAAATGRPRIMEIGYTSTAATAHVLGFGRAAAVGVTPVNVLFQAEDPGDPASIVNGSLSWATSPTIPAQFLRRFNLPATVGAGIVLTFPRGVLIAISAAMVLWNIATSVASDVWCVIDE